VTGDDCPRYLQKGLYGVAVGNTIALVVNGTDDGFTFSGVGTPVIIHNDTIKGVAVTIQILPNSTLLW